MVTNSLLTPTPFTTYPFFNLSFSTRNFAISNFNRSVSDMFLLVCNSAYLFPLLFAYKKILFEKLMGKKQRTGKCNFEQEKDF